MGTIITFAVLPFICILSTAIILTVIIYLVFRNLNLRNPSLSTSKQDKESVSSVEINPNQTDFKPVIPAKIKNKTCPACGAENKDSSLKCEYCGIKLI
jgi:hypothetical protein